MLRAAEKVILVDIYESLEGFTEALKKLFLLVREKAST